MKAAGRVSAALAIAVCAGVLAGGATVGAQHWLAGSQTSGEAETPPRGASTTSATPPASPTRLPRPSATPTPTPTPSPTPSPTTAASTRRPAATPPVVRTASPTATPSPAPKATRSPTPAPSRAPTPKPTPVAGPALLRSGDTGNEVRELQARLAQIGWFDHSPSGYYGPVTTAAVTGFQAKRRIAVTGYVDRITLDRLLGMTREPTAAELRPSERTERTESRVAAKLDPRCRSGHVLCIDKTSSTLRFVVDGAVRTTLAVRFGAEFTPTREGVFSVYRKKVDVVSTLYGSAMPFSMFFSGGQAVHYSADFAARGYNGASHGCINVRDYGGIRALYGQVRVGNRVVVYRS